MSTAALETAGAGLPVPPVNADTAFFWEGCAQGELRYQHCAACGRVQFPPRPHCAACQAPGPEWKVSRGQGTVHSFTEVHRAPIAAFRGSVPYTIALVDLDEGFRLMVNLRGGAPGQAAIGTRVRIVFEARGSVSLPQAEVIA